MTYGPLPSPAELAHMREAMVRDQLEGRGITHPKVLAAMRAVPREAFLPDLIVERAYEDCALPIDAGQTISQPYMVARMTELLLDRIPQDGAAPLDSRLSAKVLEVGTGSGYQTAVLCRIFESVYTIERVPFLYERSRVLLEAQGTQNVCHLCADGSLGWPEYAPFDRILVTAGAPDAPAPLLDQLADGAVMIIPVGAPEDQVLTRFERTGSGTRSTPILSCRFVKLIGDAGFHALA